MVARPIDSTSIKRARAELVGSVDLAGRAFARRLAQQADSWFEALAEGLPEGWALMATGGYAGGVLCPGSDIDIVLLHPQKVSATAVRDVAEPIWYPLWDAGVKLSPAAHSVKSLLQLAGEDLVTATAILRVRRIAGATELVQSVQSAALDQWRKRASMWLQRLREVSEERWSRFGDVASLLEPDLKDGRGGLRDYDAIRWALATDRDDITAALEVPIEELAGPADLLLATRCELHRITNRTTNTLLLQDQDLVAAEMGYVDADALMMTVSAAARTIDWAGDRFWRRVERLTSGRKPSAPKQLPDPIPGVAVVDDEVDVTRQADLEDPSLVFRVAAAAARAHLPISRHGLRTLASSTGEVATPWSERTRQAFVSLLGAGQMVVPTVEALEQYDLFSHYLPEWRHVRSLPQRNAFHTYTVDRHLLQTVANAAALVRDVARPDLLLVGALLHDIGKGLPGDHTDVGMELVRTMAPRLGFSADDSAVIHSLVQHHLLLPETAMRRDLSDPRTIINVATAVGDVGRLELLEALTQADSLATGPSAWSTWKAELIGVLVQSVEEVLRTGTVAAEQSRLDDRFGELAALVRADGGVHLDHEPSGEFELLRIASRDRPGLFSLIAGALALHGLDVLSAQAFTSADGIAVDEFQIGRAQGGSPNWQKVEHDLRATLDGTIDIGSRLEQRIRTYSKAHRRAIAAAAPRLEVIISNAASDSTTMIDVRAPDGLAVLYRLSHALAQRGIDIRSAKVATLGHEVVDVFYVQEPASGQVPHDAHDSLRDSLRLALTG